MPVFFHNQQYQKTATPNNLSLFRLEGFVGRKPQLAALHEWLTTPGVSPAIAISGERGLGKTTLATGAAWSLFHHFSDGILRVSAAGTGRLRLYDIVARMDTVLGTTLTRVSEDRWGISILEQLYGRRRLLIIDELAGTTRAEIETLSEIIGHLNESEGLSRILLIDRNFSDAIATLVRGQHLHLPGLSLENVRLFLQRRTPASIRQQVLIHLDWYAENLHAVTRGEPLLLSLMLGLLIDHSWEEIGAVLAGSMVADAEGKDGGHARLSPEAVVSFAVESCALGHPQVGPLLDRLVSAAGGASMQALRELFWDEGDSAESLDETVEVLVQRGLLNRDVYAQRVVLHPLIRNYLAQHAVMLGEAWERQHARYYLGIARRYQVLPLDRWSEIDVEWGNLYKGADWSAAHVENIWQSNPVSLLHELQPAALDAEPSLALPAQHNNPENKDLQLASDYALSLAHYAFWRHPPGILRWLAAGAVAALTLDDLNSYGWLITNFGRQLFFQGKVEEAVTWLERAAYIFDKRDVLRSLTYVHTDLGTSRRILNQPRRALQHFNAAFEAVAQLGDQQSLATAYMNLGSAHYSQGQHERALEAHQRALRVGMRLGNRHQIASAHNNTGLVLEAMGRLDDAKNVYEQALRVFRETGEETGISACYNNLGSVSYTQGDFAAALAWYELDLALSRERGAWTDMAATLHNLGHVALEQGDLQRSLDYFQHSRRLYNAFELEEYVREEDEMLAYVQGQIASKR